MKKYFSQLILFLLLHLIGVNTYAQCALYQIYLDQKISESEFILEGEIIQQTCFKSVSKNKIFTLNTVKVLSVFKGDLPAQIIIITAGGKIGNQMEIASSLLSLRNGQLGMFFLNKEIVETPNGHQEVFNVFSSAQGFYKYNLDNGIISDLHNNYNNANDEFYKLLNNQYNLRALKSIIPIAWGNMNTNNRLTVINNFSPASVNAGIGNQITINGFGFGSSRNDSKVLFKNTDDGGFTETEAEPSQYISWSDTKIVVVVPHKAGSGKIAVKVGAIKTQSSASLTVNYAIINTGAQDLVYPTRLVARNANKGYIWNMNANFEVDSVAKLNFLISFKKWRCKTYVNWTIGNNTTVNRSERDTISVITFDEANELPVGVLGLCYGYYSGCSDDDWYIEEQDMLFKKSDKWHFGDGAIPSDKLDFQSVVLHELGHAHQLAHVINNTDLMHYSISAGVQKRNIDASNLEAAMWTMNKSQESDICDKKRMQLLDADLCNDENFGFFNTVIYPNPFNEFLNIDFYLTSNQKLKVALYDVTGKLIATYQNENASKGFSPVVFNVPNHAISAGVYIVKIEIGEEKMVKKLIKQ